MNVQYTLPMTKRNMTPEKTAIARRARALWLKKKSAENVTQEDANLDLGWSPSLFGRYIGGKAPMGTEATVKIAGYLGVKPWDLDPSLKRAYQSAGPAPESFADMVKKLSDKEIIKIITTAARHLETHDLLTLLQHLTALLKERS